MPCVFPVETEENKSKGVHVTFRSTGSGVLGSTRSAGSGPSGTCCARAIAAPVSRGRALTVAYVILSMVFLSLHLEQLQGDLCHLSAEVCNAEILSSTPNIVF